MDRGCVTRGCASRGCVSRGCATRGYASRGCVTRGCVTREDKLGQLEEDFKPRACWVSKNSRQALDTPVE